MLLGNDAAEGSDVKGIGDADRVYLLLKDHMRRVREHFEVAKAPQRVVEQFAVPASFQGELAGIWERYLAIERALAADELETAQRECAGLGSAVATVDDTSLTESTVREFWGREHANLEKLVDKLQQTGDIDAMREAFRPLSEEIGILAKALGFGEAGPVYELHCPMAFGGQGAIWYQADDAVRNPYYGATMLKCADRVEKLEARASTVEAP